MTPGLPVGRAPTRLACLLSVAVAMVSGCGGEGAREGSAGDAERTVASEPPPPPENWREVIGEYAEGGDTFSVLEEDGVLALLAWGGEAVPLTEVPPEGEAGDAEADRFVTIDGRRVTVMDVDGRPSALGVEGRWYPRLSLGADDGGSFRITPIRPPDELRAEALAATPPTEEGDFRPAELVELVTLDSTIHLDVRYATTNNFMGEVFYSEPRAFLQRPAAEALVRAHRWLGERGYGLLIHDGYRPWYVTKMFWDATPEELRIFVADPASGSRHNRGAAVDLTLYDLGTGEPVAMTGGYDEMSPRSFPDYPGGTDRQRWHRDLLRRAMEMQDFSVYEAEWWHFDYRDWRSYRIGNQRFEELG